eukprot:3706734-Pleurochrysis_carterae.AAC.4
MLHAGPWSKRTRCAQVGCKGPMEWLGGARRAIQFNLVYKAGYVRIEASCVRCEHMRAGP